MNEFYEWLVKDYENYKKRSHAGDCPKTVRAWWAANIKPNIHTISKAPEFIKAAPNVFLTLGERYFVDLIKLEIFAYKDAMEDGNLSKILAKFNPFDGEIPVDVIADDDITISDEGDENLHAEMRLLEKHLTSNVDTSDYFGITKLCCGFCNYVFQQFSEHGKTTFDLSAYRGTHAGIFGKWLLGEAIVSEHLRILFGHYNKLYELLAKEANITLGNKGQIPQQTVALLIIQSLSTINNETRLEELGLGKENFLPDAQDMYPSDSQIDNDLVPIDMNVQSVEADDVVVGVDMQIEEKTNFGGFKPGFLIKRTKPKNKNSEPEQTYCGFKKGFLG